MLRRALLSLFVVGILMLGVGGYVAAISEWYGDKPRDEKDVIRMKGTSILLILPGGAICIFSAGGAYLFGNRE